MRTYVFGIGLALCLAVTPGFANLAEMCGFKERPVFKEVKWQHATPTVMDSSTSPNTLLPEKKVEQASKCNKKVTVTVNKRKPTDTTSTPSTTNNNQPTSKPSLPSTSTKPISSDQVSTVEKEVFRLVNVERAKNGLKPLKLSSKVSSVARKKSEDMKVNRYFSHHSPKYGSPFDMLRKFGVSFRAAGENIAAGQRSASEVMKGWMNSPGHRANILGRSFTEIGIGYVKGGSYGTYWTQQFIGK